MNSFISNNQNTLYLYSMFERNLRRFYNNNNNNINNDFNGNINFNTYAENFFDRTINNLFLEGYSMVNQIIQFHNYIINSKLNSDKKSDIVCKIAEVDQNLIKGCDEYIQFMKLVYHIMITI